MRQKNPAIRRTILPRSSRHSKHWRLFRPDALRALNQAMETP
jgi:hypothetical protein